MCPHHDTVANSYFVQADIDKLLEQAEQLLEEGEGEPGAGLQMPDLGHDGDSTAATPDIGCT